MFITNSVYMFGIFILLLHIELNKIDALCTLTVSGISEFTVQANCNLDFNRNMDQLLRDVSYRNKINYYESCKVEVYFHSEFEAEIIYHDHYGQDFIRKINKMVLTTGDSDSSIPTLPEKMINLTELILKDNKLTIAKLWNKYYLQSLKYVDYSNNYVERIESEKKTLEVDLLSNYNEYDGNSNEEQGQVFDQLVRLNLSHNKITSLNKNDFRHQQRLKVLDLSHNTISEIDLFVFTHLDQLRELNLTSNKIKDDTFLLSITPNLQKIYLGQNEIRKIISSHNKNLKKLKLLDLHSNLISELDEDSLNFMPMLEILYINNNVIQVINKNTFSNLTNIQFLDLSENRLMSLEPSLFKDKNIYNFNIKGNYIEGALEANIFSGLGSTNELDLSYQHIFEIKDFAFLGCNKLTILLLNGNDLHTIHNSAFKGLAKLTSLDLSENQLSEINFETNDLFRLVSLNLQNNNLSSINISSFNGLHALAVLDLSNNNISYIKPYLFQQMHSLTDLRLANNPITGSLQGSTFCGLNSLPQLNLAYTYLESIENNAFDGMDSLAKIILSHSHITKIEFNAFYGSTDKLQALDFSFNKIFEFKLNMSELIHLRTLILNNNNIIALENEPFKVLKELQILDISYNRLLRIDHGTFNNLLSMDFLDLSHNFNLTFNNSLVDILPVSLSNLDISATQADVTFDKGQSTLTLINLSECSITENKLEILNLKSLAEVNDVSLSKNTITNVKVGTFNNAKLRILDLSFNKIDSIQPGAFNNTPKLLLLNVSHNELSGLLFGIFKNLGELTTLDVSYNKIETLKSEMFIQLESLTVLIADHNRINKLMSFDLIGMNLHSLSIGGNTLPCESILGLQSHSSIYITAISLDHTAENIDGITCNVNKNINRKTTKVGFRNNTTQNEILEDISDIKDILLNISISKLPPHENQQDNSLKKLIQNLSDSNLDLSKDLKSLFQIQNKNNQEIINRTNLLLEKLLLSSKTPLLNTAHNNKTVDKNRDTTRNNEYTIENKDNEVIKENDIFKNQQNTRMSELENNMSALIDRLNSLSNQINDQNQTVLAAQHEKLNSDTEPVIYTKSSVFTEVCVGFMMFGMICYVIFKIYKKRSITLPSRRTISTCQMTESIENSNL